MPSKFGEEKPKLNAIKLIEQRLFVDIGDKIEGWGLCKKNINIDGNVTKHCFDINGNQQLYILWKITPDITDILLVEKLVYNIGRK